MHRSRTDCSPGWSASHQDLGYSSSGTSFSLSATYTLRLRDGIGHRSKGVPPTRDKVPQVYLYYCTFTWRTCARPYRIATHTINLFSRDPCTWTTGNFLFSNIWNQHVVHRKRDHPVTTSRSSNDCRCRQQLFVVALIITGRRCFIHRSSLLHSIVAARSCATCLQLGTSSSLLVSSVCKGGIITQCLPAYGLRIGGKGFNRHCPPAWA